MINRLWLKWSEFYGDLSDFLDILMIFFLPFRNEKDFRKSFSIQSESVLVCVELSWGIEKLFIFISD